MSELWDELDGNCFVHLFPRNSGKGPSFKIDSAVLASSTILTRMAFGELYDAGGNQPSGDRRNLPLDVRASGLSLHDNHVPFRASQQLHSNSPPASPTSSSHSSRGRFSTFSDQPADTHLYLPIKLQTTLDLNSIRPSRDGNDAVTQDLQTLIDIRNFFAFLVGSSLIATPRKDSFFHIFMTASSILSSYQFSNLDGSTFGEIASSSFDNYTEELGLADVRMSREKTIEGIVLGERMKSVFLYNEAFTHGVGKYEDLVNLKNPKFTLLSSVTDTRLIRAAMDLDKRVASAKLVLSDFDFPALWMGIAASKVSEERKHGVRFEGWKESFSAMRKNYLSILKRRYGDWPPKAKSKKNNLETSGLNRIVLREVYQDMSALYDLLVDRTSLTTRTVEGIDTAEAREEPIVRALRAVLAEYDRSSPPVKPPIPFDLPIFPSADHIPSRLGPPDAKKSKPDRKLTSEEITPLLLQSWNKDALSQPSTSTQAFWDLERRTANGCSLGEIVDMRIGQWIFIYVVLQALPMLACDAPGLQWTKGVEYFLCEPPRKGVPWASPNNANASAASLTALGSSTAPSAPGGVGRTWFSVGAGQNIVSLPADVVEHGVEGIFRRSHCWTMAEKWTQGDSAMYSALHEQEEHNAAAEAAAEAAGWGRRCSGMRGSPPPEFGLPPSSFALGQRRQSGMLAPEGQGWAGSAVISPPRSRNSSVGSGAGFGPGLAPGPGPGGKRHSSIGFGLEALNLPHGVVPDAAVTPPRYPSPGRGRGVGPGGSPLLRPRSVTPGVVDEKMTFDAILGGMEVKGKKGGKK